MKKIIALALACCLSITPSFGLTYYTKTNETTLAPGIEKIEYYEVNDDQTVVINMVKIDLQSKTSTVGLLKGSESLKEKFQLSAAITTSTVAVINGDYFNAKTNEAIGPMKDDKQWLQSGYADDTLSSLLLSSDHQAMIDYISTPTVAIEANGQYIDVNYYNMNAFHLSDDQIIVLSDDYKETSVGNTLKQDVTEVVVINNSVAEIRANQAPVIIPEDGYVLVFTGEKTKLIESNLSLGTSISINISDNTHAIDTLIRGGAKIIAEGSIVDNPMHNIKNRHPRTAVGTSDNGRYLYLITADGRLGSIQGLTQEELANHLLNFQIENAMCFDGGGSTEMMTKLNVQELASIANHPSDGYERKVYNGLTVDYVNDNQKESSYSFVSDDYYGIIAYPIELASVALDQNNMFMHNVDENISYRISGITGYFVANSFIATSAGEGIITARYKGKDYQTAVTVEENFKKLSVNDEVLQLLDDEPQSINVYGMMSNGKKVLLPSSRYHILANDGGLLVEGNKISKLVDDFSGSITINAGELSLSLPVTSQISEQVIHDFTRQKGLLKKYPEDVQASYSLTEDGKGKLHYDFTHTTATRAAYVDFANAFVFNNYPTEIAVTVDSTEANDQWLRGILTDANGKSVTIDFERYLSKEERVLTAQVPKGLSLPLTLKRIYVVETRALSQTSGTLYFDDLTVTMPVTIDVELPREENNIGTLVVIDPEQMDTIIVDEHTTGDIFEEEYTGGVLIAGQLPFNDLIHTITTTPKDQRLWILNLPYLNAVEREILSDVLSKHQNDVYFYNYQKETQMSIYLGYPHIKGPTLKIVKAAFSIYGK